MGLLVNGTWQDKWYDTQASGGEFRRQESRFRHWITADGGPGPDGQRGFAASSGRYHLYVSLACPWAHRTLIFSPVKGVGRAYWCHGGGATDAGERLGVQRGGR